MVSFGCYAKHRLAYSLTFQILNMPLKESYAKNETTYIHFLLKFRVISDPWANTWEVKGHRRLSSECGQHEAHMGGVGMFKSMSPPGH